MRVRRSGKADLPRRRHFIDDHHHRAAAVLRLVPGVEQLLLIMPSAPSNRRPPTRSTNARASSDRPERRGPVSMVALTGHMLQLRKCSNASRLASERMKRLSSCACGQSSGSAIWSGPASLRRSLAAGGGGGAGRGAR